MREAFVLPDIVNSEALGEAKLYLLTLVVKHLYRVQLPHEAKECLIPGSRQQGRSSHGP